MSFITLYNTEFYAKWTASIFLLIGMSIRGIESLIIIDLISSFVGVLLWLYVSILWKDKALILLNTAGLIFLIKNIINNIMETI